MSMSETRISGEHGPYCERNLVLEEIKSLVRLCYAYELRLTTSSLKIRKIRDDQRHTNSRSNHCQAEIVAISSDENDPDYVRSV
jgi:hypothetical protein